MNNLIPKNKSVTFVIVIASLSVILYFIGLFIVLEIKKEIENSYYNTESKSSKEEKIRIIKNITEANKELIQTLRNYFIQKDDEVKFIEQIEKVARDSGVKFDIVSIDVKTDQQDSFKENVDVKMKLEGSWQNIIYFVDKLEKMPFGVSVENMNLDTGTSGNWLGFIEFILFREK